HVPWDSIRMTALALYADAASQAGVTDAIHILYELIEPWADQIVCTDGNAYGHARLYLGLLAAALGQSELADHHFELACRFNEDNDLPIGIALTQLGRAE